jgi:plasmid stabilization system protein ParE
VDYRIFFTNKALGDLSELVEYIAEDDSSVASRFGEALLDHVDLLSRFPRLGGTTRKNSRVRKLVHSPIVVYYQLDERQCLVEVLHFRHGSRKPKTF